MVSPLSSSLPPSPSDALLVQRTLDGDARAFELLVIKYQRRVERLIGRLVRDTDMVQDLAQETFIRAYRALGARCATRVLTQGTSRRLQRLLDGSPPFRYDGQNDEDGTMPADPDIEKPASSDDEDLSRLLAGMILRAVLGLSP